MNLYENLDSLDELPKTALEGDLCKYDGQPYVYFNNNWITLNEAARMIISIQKENL